MMIGIRNLLEVPGGGQVTNSPKILILLNLHTT